MNSPDHAQLLGYLLESLDQEEHDQVERALTDNPALQAQLCELAVTKKLLDHDRDHADYDPPAGLALRTCAWLATQTVSEKIAEDQTERVSLPETRRLSELREAEVRRGFSAADTIVAAGIFLAVSFLFFPALANSRRQAHLIACQNNLRQLGVAFSDFIQRRGTAPQIPVSDNRGVAGIYAPLLHDNGTGVLVDPRLLVCPSSKFGQQPGQWRGIPSLKQIDEATGADLVELQQTMGGSYGYNLGYFVNGQYSAPRLGHPSDLVLLADSPSSSVVDLHRSDNHGPRGQNILFADGRTQHIVDCFAGRCDDDLFLNRRHQVAAGVDENDTVIGRSEVSPFRKK